MEDHMVITDFLYFEEKEVRIYADRCEIYKEFGLFLYKGNQLISHIKNKIVDVNLVEVAADTQAHYYIRSEDWSSYYLVTKSDSPKVTILPEMHVILKGNDSFTLTTALLNDSTVLEQHKEEIEKAYFWKVISVVEEIMLILEKGGVQKYVTIEDVIPVEMIQENTQWLKNFLESKKKN